MLCLALDLTGLWPVLEDFTELHLDVRFDAFADVVSGGDKTLAKSNREDLFVLTLVVIWFGVMVLVVLGNVCGGTGALPKLFVSKSYRYGYGSLNSKPRL